VVELDWELLEVEVELPVQVVQGGPVELLVEHELVEEDDEKVTDVAQGIYTTSVVVEHAGGGHVVAQFQTVDAVPPGQPQGWVRVVMAMQSSCVQGDMVP